ncbi:MAG: hypothetical protein R3E89_14460 [Thiolinea sp.]
MSGAGVYIAINGEVFGADNAVKNLEALRGRAGALTKAHPRLMAQWLMASCLRLPLIFQAIFR